MSSLDTEPKEQQTPPSNPDKPTSKDKTGDDRRSGRDGIDIPAPLMIPPD